MTRAPLLLALLAAGANAAPIPARLVYDASGTSCPGKEELMRAVRGRVGMDPFDNGASSTLMVQVNTTPKGLTATVVRMKPDGTGTGRRELSSTKTDCRELFQAIELEVTLAIDPLAKTTPAPLPVPPPPPPAPVTELVPPPPPPTTPNVLSVPSAPAAPSVGYQRGDAPSDTPVDRMTRGALLAEKQRLEESRPASGLPLVFAGVGAFTVGIVLNVIGFTTTSPFNSSAYIFNLLGAAAGVAGTVLMIVGVSRRVTFNDRLELLGLRLKDIDAQVAELGRSNQPEPGPPQPRAPYRPAR